MRDLLSFSDFYDRLKVFEAKGKGGNGTNFIFAAQDEAGKKSINEFIAHTSTLDPTKLDNLLNSILEKGAGVASKLGASMEKRKELDAGPLKKKGEYYVGEGAWRINSAKFAQMGLTPEGVEYFDPNQAEILAKYFAEDDKSDVSVGPDGEIQGMDMEYEEPAEAGVEAEGELEREPEYAMAESMKYLESIYEQDSFSLGPPESAKNAVILDGPALVNELVDNFMMETRENVMIWGAPGIGKTQIVKQVAKTVAEKLGKDKADIPVTIITLATKASYDISGIPIQFISSTDEPEGLNQNVIPDKHRGKVGMDFAYPAWLPGPDDNREGILFFDEINRADVDTMGAALSLLLDRVSGSYKMPDSWRIWAAGNRGVDGPVKPFEGAMASRFLGGHVHLVPTVEAWVEWARSDNAFFQGTQEWYIPGEFLSFINLKDVHSAAGSEVTNLGKTYRTKFEYFYNWGEADADASGEGKSEGFPNPRTWTKAFSNVYQKLRSNSSLMAKVDPKTDPKERVISMFGFAVLDPKIKEDIIRKMSMVVGTTAVDAFIVFVEQLARLNDSDGTLVEKIDNVFFDPSKPRPLLNIDKLGMDERFGVMQAVQGKFEYLVSKGELDTQAFSNWQKYLIDLEDNKKAEPSDLQAHVSVLLQKFVKEIRKITDKSNPLIKGPVLDIMRKFANKYKDYAGQVNSL